VPKGHEPQKPKDKPEKTKKPKPEEAASPTQATVIVQVPEDAKLYVDGELSEQTSTTRTFISPDLQLGKDYSYTLKMEANKDGRTAVASKRVIVRAGAVTRVNFTDQNSAGTVRPEEKPAPARVTVQLPTDARLLVDGVASPLTSSTRTFDTPALEPGRKYFYILTAEVVREGRPVSDSRRVLLQAGKEVKVDFGNVAAFTTASR
jgi:uncharacterized protein (TIGR03000 family)